MLNEFWTFGALNNGMPQIPLFGGELIFYNVGS